MSGEASYNSLNYNVVSGCGSAARCSGVSVVSHDQRPSNRMLHATWNTSHAAVICLAVLFNC